MYVMTPAERVVVEAARRFLVDGDRANLEAAVAALDSQQPSGEHRLTWGQVCEGDHVQVKGGWYEVLQAKPGEVRAKAGNGQVGSFKRPPGDPVLVRRGESGRA